MMAAILLLLQINVIASLPVANGGDQKQDFLYRDNNVTKGENALHGNTSSSGQRKNVTPGTIYGGHNVTKEKNALHRNTSSSDQKNSTTLNVFFKHVRRPARGAHGCVKRGPSRVYLCGKDRISLVSCEKTSFACVHKGPAPICREITSVCSINGKILVTGCTCA